MFEIKRFVCNVLAENTYIVSDETKECVIIDCGAFYQEEKDAIAAYIEKEELKPVHLLVTHAHIDHNFGNNFVLEKYGLKAEVCAEDEFLMNKMKGQPAQYLKIMHYEEPFPPVARYFRNGEMISFGNHQFKAINTPGHTPGCTFFYCEEEKIAFSGDTLFRFSVGRTDLEGGDMHAMDNSLHNIVAKLPWDTVVYPGHGEKTTIREEMFSNPYLGSLGIY